MKRWEDYDTIQYGDELIDMQKVLDDVMRARTAAMHLHPIGHLIGKLQLEYTFKIPTWATDGRNLLINPYFTSKRTPSELVFLFYHEVLHCVLNHLRRAKIRRDDMMQANLAGDYECNYTITELNLIDEGTIKNLGAYYNKKFIGMGYEAIYDDISKNGLPSGDRWPGGANENRDKEEKRISKSQEDAGMGKGRGGSGGGEPKSQAWKDGWNKAIADYYAGRLQI